jgi:hypothetical protein
MAPAAADFDVSLAEKAEAIKRGAFTDRQVRKCPNDEGNRQRRPSGIRAIIGEHAIGADHMRTCSHL